MTLDKECVLTGGEGHHLLLFSAELTPDHCFDSQNYIKTLQLIAYIKNGVFFLFCYEYSNEPLKTGAGADLSHFRTVGQNRVPGAALCSFQTTRLYLDCVRDVPARLPRGDFRSDFRQLVGRTPIL